MQTQTQIIKIVIIKQTNFTKMKAPSRSLECATLILELPGSLETHGFQEYGMKV